MIETQALRPFLESVPRSEKIVAKLIGAECASVKRH